MLFENVTVLDAEVVHPFPSAIVTEYTPLLFTLMQLVVAPVLHAYEVLPDVAQSCITEPIHAEDCPETVALSCE